MRKPYSGNWVKSTMAKVVFSPEAKNDLVEIGDYVAFQLRNKFAAKSLMERIRQATMSLAQFPDSGTPIYFAGPSIAYRYLLCGNYLIFYHQTEKIVYIDRVLYGRRDYLSILFGNEFPEDEEL